MIKSISLTQLGSLPQMRRIKDLAGPVFRALTLSLADEAVSPAASLSISIEKGSLRMAYVGKFLSGYTLVHSKTYPLAESTYPAAGEVSSTATLFLSEKGLKRAPVTLCIPKAWTVTKISEFPSSAADSLADAIPYEMDRLTPFTAEEVLYDFRTLGISGDKIRFVLAATRIETVKNYLDALKGSGFAAARLTSNSSAIGTLAGFAERGRNRAQILLEITAASVEASSIVGGAVRGSISAAAPQGEAKVQAVEEAVASLAAGLKKEGLSPSVIAWFNNPDPRLKEIMRTRWTGIRFLDELNFRIKGIREKAGLPMNALGGAMEALLPGSAGINMLSKGRREKAKKSFILTLLLAAAFLAMFSVYSIAPIWKEKALIGLMDKKIGSMKKEALSVEKVKQEIEGLDNKISSIKDFNRGEVRKVVILKDLTRLIPDDTWINRLRITDDGVEIYGYSEAATKLIPKLSASKYLVNVEFASPTMRDSRMDMDRFSIKAKIKGAVTAESQKIAESPKKAEIKTAPQPQKAQKK